MAQGPQNQPRYPVIVITGFLGSGKTTLLNRLLASPALSDTAVIVNELGEIALDHLLIESAIENALVLQSGCICCTVRGDLVDTIADLADKAARGVVPAFSRIIIETTGLADPGPVLATVATEPLLQSCSRLQGVVTTLDCVNGQSQLARFPEPARQIALADTVLLTKSDIAPSSSVEALAAKVRAINPSAAINVVVRGDIAPDILLCRTAPDADATADRVAQWLGATGHQDHPHETSHDEIRAHSITLPGAQPWAHYRRWLRSIVSLRGADILRLKGLLAVEGRDGPVVVHTIHHLVHPPTPLAQWPSDDRRTRVVVIGQHLTTIGLQASLRAGLAFRGVDEAA